MSLGGLQKATTWGLMGLAAHFQSQAIMHLKWTTKAAVFREEQTDYFHDLEIDVLCPDEEAVREFVVARIDIDHILWGKAVAEGASYFDLFEKDFQGWHDLYDILTGGTDPIRREYRLHHPIESAVCVHQAVFHPESHSFRVTLVDTVLRLFGPETVAAVWSGVGGLSGSEQDRLGLRRVEGRSEMLFRHNLAVPPIQLTSRERVANDLHGTSSIQAWV
jgi:hypothetical protein